MNLWAAGLLMELGFIGLIAVRTPSKNFALLAVVYSLLFLGLVAVFLQTRGRGGLLTTQERWSLWGFAVLFRLTLVAMPPALTYDVYQGLPTIPPPLIHLTTRMGSWMGGMLMTVVGPMNAEAIGQKSIFLLFDLLSINLLCRLLKDQALPESRVVYYAWNPLIVLEFAGSGRPESLGIFCLLAAIALWSRRRTVFGSAAWIAAFLSKYLVILILPAMGWQKRWKELVLFLAGGAVGIFFFSGGPLSMELAGFPFLERPFNGSIYLLANGLINNEWLAKRAMALLLAGFAIWAGKKQNDTLTLCYMLTAVMLLLSPVVHPWYFTWLVPFLCFFPNLAFIVWNGTIVLAYTAIGRAAAFQTWDLHPLTSLLEYVPVFALGVYAVLRRRTLLLIPRPTSVNS